MPSIAGTKLPFLQCLRAIAAGGVVFMHAHMEAERFSTSPPWVPADVAAFGNYGVDLFFVISGFVIYYSNFPRALPATDFFLRRAWRIVPLYAMLTLLAFLLRQTLSQEVFVSPSPSLADLLVSITFTSGHRPIIGAGWTLEFEMFFYGCTALAIALLAQRWSLVTYALAGLAVVGKFAPSETGALKVLMDPLLLEFTFGLVAAEIYCTHRVPILRLAAIGGAVLLTINESPSIAWAGLPAALLVYAAAALRSTAASGAAVRILCAVGDASYSIYLIQFFTLPVIGRAAQAVFHGQSPNLLLALGFLGTLGAGYVCYATLERRLLVLFRGRVRELAKHPGSR